MNDELQPAQQMCLRCGGNNVEKIKTEKRPADLGWVRDTYHCADDNWDFEVLSQ